MLGGQYVPFQRAQIESLDCAIKKRKKENSLSSNYTIFLSRMRAMRVNIAVVRYLKQYGKSQSVYSSSKLPQLFGIIDNIQADWVVLYKKYSEHFDR